MIGATYTPKISAWFAVIPQMIEAVIITPIVAESLESIASHNVEVCLDTNSLANLHDTNVTCDKSSAFENQENLLSLVSDDTECLSEKLFDSSRLFLCELLLLQSRMRVSLQREHDAPCAGHMASKSKRQRIRGSF